MDNVHERNTCINVPSSQTFRSYLFLRDLDRRKSDGARSGPWDGCLMIAQYGFCSVSKHEGHHGDGHCRATVQLNLSLQ
jgi:hypothetical protein